MRKARATQNSASSIGVPYVFMSLSMSFLAKRSQVCGTLLPLDHGIECLKNLVAGWLSADEPLDDCACGLAGNCADIGHGCRALGGNRLLRLGNMQAQFRIDLSAPGLGLSRGVCACFVGKRLRTTARLVERLLVRGRGGIGEVLEALRLRQILIDAPAPFPQDRFDARQRDSRHQDIKRDEGKGEPEELRWKA